MDVKTNLLVLCLASLLLSGCQSVQPLKQPGAEIGGFMSLWNTYSHCQTNTDFEQLRHDASVLIQAAQKSRSQDTFILPLPGKLDQYVTTPSARFAVDVKAMSAACSLRAGQAAVEAQQIETARELLHSILAYQPQSDYAFYSGQAEALLSTLEPTKIQVSLSTR